MAFGDNKGFLEVAANSATNPTNLAGSVAVVVGDLVVVVFGEQTAITATTTLGTPTPRKTREPMTLR
jgi:hypothetical protein